MDINTYTMNNQDLNSVNMMSGMPMPIFDMDPNLYGIAPQGMMPFGSIEGMISPEQQLYQEQQMHMQMQIQMQKMQMQMQMEGQYLIHQQQQQQQAIAQDGSNDVHYVGEQLGANHPMFLQYQETPQHQEQSNLQEMQLNSQQNM